MQNFRKYIQKYIDVQHVKMLEIGAVDEPTFTKHEANIYFVDAHKNERCADAIVAVDYIIHSNEYEKYIHDRFDVIIADNVFEHISNPIRWLQTLNALLEDNGYVFLRIPEYNVIFDKFRAPTTFAHILTDYIRNVPDLDPEHSVEVGIYYDMNYVREENKLHEKINFKRSLNDYNNPHYGVHCHTFSCRSFVNKIMKPILMLGVVDFKFLECSESGTGEFIIALQKSQEEVNLTFDEFTEDEEIKCYPKIHASSELENIFCKNLPMVFEAYDPFAPESSDFTFQRWLPQSIQFSKEILPLIQETISIYLKNNPNVNEVTIADVGGGIGAGSEYIRARLQIYFDKIEDRDITINMTVIEINKAHKEWCERFSPKIIFQYHNISNLDEKRYDFIISSHTIEHVEQPSVFIEAMQQLARKNVFVYAPYNEPLPSKTAGHINTISDHFISQFMPLRKLRVNSEAYALPCVLFVLPGKARD